MKRKVTRRNIVLLSVPTIIVVIIAATLFYFFNQMKAADKLRTKTTLTLNSAQKILTFIVDSEIGVRGYVITGDRKFIQPYTESRENIKLELNNLYKNTNTNETITLIENIESLIKQQFDFFAVILASENTDLNTLLHRFINSDRQNRMYEIRDEIKKYQQAQTIELQAHRNSHIKYMNYLFSFIVIVSIFMLLYAQAFAYGIYRNIHQRLMDLVHLETKRSLEKQEALNKELQSAYSTLQDGEMKLEVTLNSIADGVIATDCNGNITLMNYVAEGLTKSTIEKSGGKSIGEIFHLVNKETRETILNPAFETLLQGFVQGASDNILILADGTEYNIAHSCAPIRDHDGQVIGSVLVFRDITSENAAQQTLLDNTELIQTIQDTVIDGIVTFNARTLIIESVNTATENMFGYKAAELIGQKLTLSFLI